MSKKDGPFSLLAKDSKSYIGSEAPSIWDHTLFHPSPSLNFALGGRGFVYGKIALFYGPESSGKSLNAMIMIAEMQRLDPEGCAIYISTEYDIPREKMEAMGIDMSRVLCKETNIPHEIFDWIENDVQEQIRAGTKIKILVIDTVKGIRGPKEMNLQNTEDHIMGDLSSYLQKAFRLILDGIRTHKVFTILVQQVTEEMDVTRQRQGHKWHIPNGKALHHACDYFCLFEKISRRDSRIYDDSIKQMNDSFLQIGHRIRVKVEKNRTAGADRMAEFDIMYDRGVVNAHKEIAELAPRIGIVERPNNRTYTYKENKWTSKSDYELAIESNKELAAEIYGELLKKA